jgi:hypothetical protein
MCVFFHSSGAAQRGQCGMSLSSSFSFLFEDAGIAQSGCCPITKGLASKFGLGARVLSHSDDGAALWHKSDGNWHWVEEAHPVDTISFARNLRQFCQYRYDRGREWRRESYGAFVL